MLGGYPQDGSVVDSAVTWLLSTFVDGRAFPMFGLLFGYGVAQIVRRQDLGPKAVRRLLWRRSLVLVAVGFLHAVLLYVGDILTAYGVLLFLGVWAIRWSDRWLLAVAGLFLALGALPSAAPQSISSAPPDAAMLPPDLLTQLTERPRSRCSSRCSGPSVSPARSWSGCGPAGAGSSSSRSETDGSCGSPRSAGSASPCSAPSPSLWSWPELGRSRTRACSR